MAVKQPKPTCKQVGFCIACALNIVIQTSSGPVLTKNRYTHNANAFAALALQEHGQCERPGAKLIGMPIVYAHLLLVVVGVIASITDLWRQKIYNWLTLPALLLGLLLNGLQFGWRGLLDSFLGFLLAFVIYMVLGLLGVMKGGDVKLAAAVGAMLGWRLSISALFYGAIFGGLLAIVWALVHGTLSKTLTRVGRALYAALAPGMRHDMELQESESPPMPYGVAISAGAFASVWWLPPVTQIWGF